MKKLLSVIFLLFIASQYYSYSQLIPDSVISLNTHLDNNYWIKDKKDVYLYLDLQALKIELGKKRAPMNISIVLDHSGSMSGDKIKFAIEACKFIVNNLSEEDYLSVIKYDDKVEVVCKSALVSKKNEIYNLISQISPDGGTNLSGGLLEGYVQAKSTYDRNRINRVLLITDGLANAGITDSTKLNQIVRNKNLEDGITLSTFGVGSGFNERLLTAMAESGNGNYYFIDKADRINSIFAKELNGLVSVIANNTKVSVNYPSFYLSPSTSFGFKFDLKNNQVNFDLKDVASQEQKSMLIKFSIQNQLTENIIFNTVLEYDNAISKIHFTTLTNDTLIPTLDKPKFDLAFNEDAIANIAMFETNVITENAMDDLDSRSYDKCQAKLGSARAILVESKKRSPNNKEIDKQIKIVDEYDRQVEKAKNMKDEELNVMQKAYRSTNYEIKKKK